MNHKNSEKRESFASSKKDKNKSNTLSIIFWISVVLIYIGIAVLYFQARLKTNDFGPLLASVWPFKAIWSLCILSKDEIIKMIGEMKK